MSPACTIKSARSKSAISSGGSDAAAAMTCVSEITTTFTTRPYPIAGCREPPDKVEIGSRSGRIRSSTSPCALPALRARAALSRPGIAAVALIRRRSCPGYPGYPAASGGVPVLVVEPAQHGQRGDAPAHVGRRVTCRDAEGRRRPLVQRLVRPSVVEVADVLR